MSRFALFAGPALALGLLAAVLAALAASSSCGVREAPPAPPDGSARLREAVTTEGILEHTRRFGEIAEQNGGNRAAGTPGYDASAEYVADRLREAGYDVTIQPFEFPYFEEISPPKLELAAPGRRVFDAGDDFRTLEYSGSGDVTAPVRPAAQGCETGDFASFERGSVALLRRGTCTFEQKAGNAQRAGASAVIVFDPSGEGSFSGSLRGPGIEIPALSVGSTVGEELGRLAEAGDATVHVATSTHSENRETANVIAESESGREGEKVVVGAHLDSVPEGPGINDNASGSSTVLEIAEEMSESGVEPRNRVCFAFWGAEELGLLGSKHYVEGLPEREVEEISAYLNFDMLGSPNGGRFVYNDSGNPRGSEKIEEVFTDYFESQDLESEADDTLVGRSDHGPFAERGVPVGGLFSGAEGTKTAREAEDYGGEIGSPHDPCYHSSCDGPKNLDVRSLDEMSDAAAHAVLHFAQAQGRGGSFGP